MIILCTSLVVLLSLPFSVSAQYPYYYGNGGLTGSVIAGIVIAVIVGLLVMSLCCLMGARRRRGRSMLGGRFTRRPDSYVAGPPNTSQTNAPRPFGQTWNSPPAPFYPPPTNQPPPPPPPPPYHSKDSYQGQPNGNVSQEGYPTSPAQPPAAHVNGTDRYGWFNRDTEGGREGV